MFRLLSYNCIEKYWKCKSNIEMCDMLGAYRYYHDKLLKTDFIALGIIFIYLIKWLDFISKVVLVSVLPCR